MPIEIKNVSFVYNPGEPTEKKALEDIDLTIREGEFVGIIGHTGSGKSTLIQMLNGLITPTKGQILLNGQDIHAFETEGSKKKKRLERARRLKDVRRRVGLVFQYPEHQLFEMTVEKDVSFGPKNLGLSEDEIRQRVDDSLKMVGLGPEIKEKSPFELSGGQKRRVAIAGVLAMKPDFLILDEPTAGLDPQGRDEILDEVSRLQKEQGIGVILVSHSMEDVAKHVDRLIALENGKVRYDAPPREVFAHADELTAMGLGVPQVTQLGRVLEGKGFHVQETILTMDEMEAAILDFLNRKAFRDKAAGLGEMNGEASVSLRKEGEDAT